MELHYYFAAFIILTGLIMGYLEKEKFFPSNRKLFDFIENNSDKLKIRIDSAECTFKGNAGLGWSIYKLWGDGKILIITGSYDLNLSPGSKLSAETYLVGRKEELVKYDAALFRNIIEVESTTINKDQNLIIEGTLLSQSVFKKIGWIPYAETKLKIKRPYYNFDFSTLMRIDRDVHK